MTRIFINYRQSESLEQARRLAESLQDAFGNDGVFHDHSALRAGDRWREVLTAEVDRCRVFLVLIGEGWLTAQNPLSGERRLDEPEDVVRFEIERALAKAERESLLLIPVLLDGARLPRKEHLPTTMKSLVEYQLERVSTENWDADVSRLTRLIRERSNASGWRDIDWAPQTGDAPSSLVDIAAATTSASIDGLVLTKSGRIVRSSFDLTTGTWSPWSHLADIAAGTSLASIVNGPDDYSILVGRSDGSLALVDGSPDNNWKGLQDLIRSGNRLHSLTDVGAATNQHHVNTLILVTQSGRIFAGALEGTDVHLSHVMSHESTIAASCSAGPRGIDVASVRRSGEVIYSVLKPSGAFEVERTEVALSTKLSDVAIASRWEGHLETFANTTHGQVLHRWRNTLDGQWSLWHDLESVDAKRLQVAAVSSGLEKIEVLIGVADGRVGIKTSHFSRQA